MTLARKATGAWGEERAAAHLAAAGMAVLERNVSSPFGELDIIAQDGDTLVFVEVKAFESLPPGADPAENVHRSKQRRLGRCAAAYLTRFEREPPCRFDVVTVVRTPEFRLQHFAGAFML